MRTRRAQSVLDQLRRLASDDESRLVAVKDRLARAEQELGSARSAFESANARAQISRRVALAAEELLPHAAAGQAQTSNRSADPKGAAPDGRAKTLREELFALARGRRHVTRTEIVDHLSSTRPDIKITGVGPELTRLVRLGLLVRVGLATYAMPATTRGDDA
ncbi:hypothetical protein [Streptomyces sp. NPDC127112]|uniref:hypothetical protein n=1 Tax=Streptomyces sp. NPDC127112 TaxID=3345364 RepID=UPI0036268D1D